MNGFQLKQNAMQRDFMPTKVFPIVSKNVQELLQLLLSLQRLFQTTGTQNFVLMRAILLRVVLISLVTVFRTPITDYGWKTMLRLTLDRLSVCHIPDVRTTVQYVPIKTKQSMLWKEISWLIPVKVTMLLSWEQNFQKYQARALKWNFQRTGPSTVPWHKVFNTILKPAVRG